MLINFGRQFGLEFWYALLQMAPYLLLGFFVAGVLSVFISPETVEKHLGGGGVAPIFKASAFGVPLPLCSCGVIPVAASLKRHGASSGATTAFLISTPETGVDSILVTYSLLGPVYAIFRPFAALVSGLTGGLLVMYGAGEEKNVRRSVVHCTDECCRPASYGHSKVWRIFHYGFLTLPRDIGRALVVGLVIAGVIAALVPKDFFASIFSNTFLQMLVMLAVGIPVYVCASGSVPIALALIHAGISPGAALVFMMTGPATNAATIATVWKTMGKKTAVIYITTVAAMALLSGFILDGIYRYFPHLREQFAAGPGMEQGHALPGMVGVISAYVLIALLAFAVFRRSLGRLGGIAPIEVEAGEAFTFTVGGMNCDHCVESVTRALKGCAGVDDVNVDLKAGSAIICGDHLDAEALRKAVVELGYSAGEPERLEDVHEHCGH
jgi:hypothetical protein